MTNTVSARNPAAEAADAVGDRSLVPLVLEPSPPADLDPAFFADDPTDPTGRAGTVVSPVGDGDVSWVWVIEARPDLLGFAQDRWLGPWKRLGALPPGFGATRDALHQVAFFAVAPKRHAVNGKLGLRYTHRGFGTPFFGDDEQVRVEAGVLVRQHGDAVESAPLTSVRSAAEFLGIDYRPDWFADFHDPLSPVDPDEPLDVDAESSLALGDWFGFSTSVLEELRRIDGGEDVSRVQLWPEHFDPAIEIGSADRGRRAGYGASPGDAAHRDPYLYVAPWGGFDEGDPFWNATGFGGALLSYEDLLGAADQRASALDFYRTAWARLNG